MNKISVMVVATILISMMLSLKFAYGASSLNELQGEVNTDTTYKAELVNYITSHNMTVYSENGLGYKINPNSLSMDKLEHTVKYHMEECQNGMHDINVNFTLNVYKDSNGDGRYDDSGKKITEESKQEEKDLLDQWGDC